MRPANTNNKPMKKVNLNRIFVIIPAVGLEVKVPSEPDKPVLEVGGVSVIERTLSAFQNFAVELARVGTSLRAVVVTKDTYVFKVNGICRYKKFNFVQNVVSGGETRMESVWKGIEALSELPFPPTDNDVVLIHDGSRCLIDEDTLERCVEASIQHEIVAASIPANSSIKDTMPVPTPAPTPAPAPVEQPRKSALGLDLSKFPSLAERLSKNSVLAGNTTPTPAPTPAPAPVEEPKPIFKSVTTNAPAAKNNVATDDSKEVQTPQAFRFNKLLKIYVNGIKRNMDVIDDTELARALNFKIHFIDGSADNIQVTTPEDVSYAEAIIKRQETEQKDS